MKILIVGAGVIGATYAWKLSDAGYDVTILVREARKSQHDREGIILRCVDERGKDRQPVEKIFWPSFITEFSPADGFNLIMVCVKSNQLENVLPLLAEKGGGSDILFCQSNWWGDQIIGEWLAHDQYFFGYSRLVGGWRVGNHIQSVIFAGAGRTTLLGEKDGQTSPRLGAIKEVLARAGLRPEISPDILGWLMAHYVEYLGMVGGVLKAGSVAQFAANDALIREAVLATREGLDVCRARGLDLSKSAPLSLRMFYLPPVISVPLAKFQYGAQDSQQFFDKNVAHGMDEIAAQYFDVISEGKRLRVAMPHLEAFEPFIRNTARRTHVFSANRQ